MVKINDTTTFPNTTPTLTDHVPGTDVSNTANDANGETVTFTFQALMDLYEANFQAPADFIDAITEIAASLKSGADGTLVTGTAGTSGDLAVWNVDGDLVDGPTPPSGTIIGTTDTQTLTNKTIDGDSNTISNLDLGNEVDWAAIDDVSNASSFTTGDKVLIFEAGVGMRKVDYDDLPSGGGSLSNIVEDTTPQLGGDLDLNGAGLTVTRTNDNAGAITVGQAVYLKSNGNVDLADSDSSGTAVVFGFVADASIASAGSGAIAVSGVVSGFDTSSFTVGSVLYVSGTAGALTATRPAANATPVAICLTSHASTGSILIAGAELFDQITDGQTMTDSNGNEILQFNVVASAVNHLEVGNNSTGNTPTLTALGGDTDVGIDLVTKGNAPIECSTGQRMSIYIPAAAMISRTTTGAAANTTELATNDVMLETMDFDASADEHVQFSFTMPKNWNASTITFQAYWSHPSTTTNFGVAFALQAVAFANDDALDTAFGTAVLVTDTGGTTDDLYISPESAAVTIAGSPAAEEMAYFQVYRDVSDAGDTMSVDARLHGIRVFYDVIALTED